MNPNYDSSDNFVDADDFIDCFRRGCELGFNYNGRKYAAWIAQDDRFGIWEVGNECSEVAYETPEAMLEHPIGGKRLRDILQDMEVTDRTMY